MGGPEYRREEGREGGRTEYGRTGIQEGGREGGREGGGTLNFDQCTCNKVRVDHIFVALLKEYWGNIGVGSGGQGATRPPPSFKLGGIAPPNFSQ